MRVTLGAVVVLGLVVAVATAQPPAPRERAAVFKAPQPLAPNELPPVARGVADTLPPSALPTTPVARSRTVGVAGGPAWINGVDPNVLPASGLGSRAVGGRNLTPPTGTGSKDESQSRFTDRFRGTSGGGKPAPVHTHPMPAQTEQPTSATPFRGTGTNGAPVYAGPPAYRWYGWGSVTPGANPLAPAGQYPKASANWYSITGATPGAFPVPVSNAARPTPGMEPPTYGMAGTASTQPRDQFVAHEQPQHHAPTYPEPRPAVSKSPAPTDSKFMPAPTPPSGLIGGSVSVPTLAAPPVPKATALTPTEPVAPKEPIAQPVAVLPPPGLPTPSAEPRIAPLPTVDPKAASTGPKPTGAEPKALPTSVTTDPPRDEHQWKPAGAPSSPQPGTWTPANGVQPLPAQPAEQGPSWQSGSATVRPIVVRGQMESDKPEPVAALIKQMCQGRAEGVEIRWTGTKKLQVCFEIRTQPEAKQLVDDISKRAELNAYQIDFCAVVK